MARDPATSIEEPPRKCRMLTPLSKPSRLTSMKRSAGPWNQVAIIRPSGCQTMRKRSQSPASRQTAQFCTTSRMRSRSISAASIRPCLLLADVPSILLAGILDVRILVELDDVEQAVYLCDAPDINGLHDVARFGIDHDRAGRAH